MKTIHYYFSPKSPWTYLGHDRLLQLAEQHGARVQPKPIDLGRVFPISGGLPLNQRPPQRQAYRLLELTRWSTYLDLPLTLEPKFFPVDDKDAAKMVLAAANAGDDSAALRLAGALLRAVWAQERDIADRATLIQIANEVELDGAALYSERQAASDLYDSYTKEAIDLQVFGAPWYVYRDEPFWGQDRLALLDRALAA